MKRDEPFTAEGVVIKAKQQLYINPFLSHLLELLLLGFAHWAHPIGRQILKCRIGRNATFNIAKLRVIDPFANFATILLHLFHVV